MQIFKHTLAALGLTRRIINASLFEIFIYVNYACAFPIYCLR
jgi:hypothetical protein